MKLYMTNDGMSGLKFPDADRVLWINNIEKIKHMMVSYFSGIDTPEEVILEDIKFAISELQKHKHSVAHFGVFGTFMFTTEE